MGGIPVLNDNQMNALRRIVGTNQKFNLTVAPKVNSRRLPSYADEGGDSVGHPFDAMIVNAGTEDHPVWKVRIYNSALPDSPYAGVVYVGDWDISVPVESLSVTTDGGFFVVLAVTYDSTQNPPFPVSLSVVPYGNSTTSSSADTFRKVIAEGKLPEIASRGIGDVSVNGRYI